MKLEMVIEEHNVDGIEKEQCNGESGGRNKWSNRMEQNEIVECMDNKRRNKMVVVRSNKMNNVGGRMVSTFHPTNVME